MEQLAAGGQPEIPCPQKLLHKIYGLQARSLQDLGDTLTAVLERSTGEGSGPSSVSFLKGFYGRAPREDKAGPYAHGVNIERWVKGWGGRETCPRSQLLIESQNYCVEDLNFLIKDFFPAQCLLSGCHGCCSLYSKHTARGCTRLEAVAPF